MSKIAKKSKKLCYSEAEYTAAASEHKNGEKISVLARKLNVPYSTLHYKLTNSLSFGKKNFFVSYLAILINIHQFLDTLRPGPRPYLSNPKEKELVQWILDGQRIGQPKSRFEIKHAAWILSEEDANCRKFSEKGPSNGFLDRFLKRHPNLSSRKPEALTTASANVTKGNLINWFDNIERYFVDNGRLDILDDPRRVFNCDEAGFL